MRTWCSIRLPIPALVALLAIALSGARAQEPSASGHARKVTRRVVPDYPDLARKLRLSGKVRLVAVVAPDGSVKLAQPVGGNPVLLKSATDAVMQWRYVAGSEESQELIEFEFGKPK